MHAGLLSRDITTNGGDAVATRKSNPGNVTTEVARGSKDDPYLLLRGAGGGGRLARGRELRGMDGWRRGGCTERVHWFGGWELRGPGEN